MIVKNVEVTNLERAARAIENSFNVGSIDTTKGNVKEKLAKSLGSNKQPYQSHDAWLAGVIVDFDLLNCEDALYKKLLKNRYFTVSSLKTGGFHVNTNFRALKHFNLKHPEEEGFKSVCNTFEKFSELTEIN